MLAYLFPGQGSQFRGMGGDLFDNFKQYTAQADAVLGYSIKSLCLEDSRQQLIQTEFTQPALYVVNALSYLKKIQDGQQKPDYVAGHSLGEYNALFAAGVFDFITGLKLVKKRGELMNQAQGGGMAAVIGLQKKALLQQLKQHDLATISIANYNSYLQSVITGPKSDIEHSQSIFTKMNNVTFIPLKVSGAFHSNHMQSAQKEFADYLQNFEFNIPDMPVLANINALPYHPQVIRQQLANQITHPVEWVKIIQYMKSKNVISFEEVGPGTVLTGLLKKISNNQ